MTARRDLAESVIAVDAAVSALFTGMGAELRKSVLRHARDTPDGLRIDQEARLKIMRDVDRILDQVYPKRRGGPSPLEDVIVRHAVRTRRKPIASEVETMRSILKNERDLLKAMGDRGPEDRAD